ncbi:MAG: hypothetical protein M3512_12660 [Bacteroidota bacterium]|nr:hypothetical protein [Bacteroidota bacterium]
MRLLISLASLLLISMMGCRESEYTRLVKNEHHNGLKKDSLLFNIAFGNSKSEFYNKCWELNKQELVTHAPSNQAVQYVILDSMVHDSPTKIMLYFFPTFDEQEIINGMNMEFSYLGWAPWNRQYQSDSLMMKVVQILEKWYGGNPFIYVDFENNPVKVPIKVDGNRRIIVRIKDTQTVMATIHDISHKEFKHSL